MTREEDARRLAEVYSAQARGYADGWSPIIRPIGRNLLAALAWPGARRVLDVGAGVGAHFSDIRSLAPGAWVLGIDRSPGMLELARAHGVPLALMDAMDLGLRTASIDVAVMIFVLFHLPDPVTALGEIRRVLRPRGMLGTTTWAEDPEVEASRVWEEELDRCGATDPMPIPARGDALMNSPEKMAELFSTAGFEPVRVWVEPVEHRWDVNALFALHVGFGRTKRKLESIDPDRRTTFLERVRQLWAGLGPNAFLYRATVVCGTACR